MRRGGAWPTLAAFLLGLAWALGIPVVHGLGEPFGNWQPDEVSHVLTVRWWAGHLSLPPYNADYAVSVHPPLYHALGALVWRVGDALAVRVFSAVLGAATVLFTFRAARALYSGGVATLAAWLVALVPMRASLSGGISNENLAALAATAALALLAEELRGRRRLGGLVLWCMAGVASKLTCLGLLPAVVLALAWRFGPQRAARAAVALGLATVATLTGWFWGNAQRCGDALCKGAADRLWDGVQPGYPHYQATRGFSPLRYLFSIAAFGWRSFWGTFDGLQKHLPMPVFLLLLGGQLTTFWGARRRGGRVRQAWLLAASVLFLTTAVIYTLFNLRHYSPQGRYFYVILAPFGAITGYGYLALWPPVWRTRAAQGLVAALGGLNLWCLWHYLPAR